MRRLLLIRHAQAIPHEGPIADFDRPLSARGRREASAMASQVAEDLHAPPRLVASPAQRALGTAEIFADALAVPVAGIVREPRIYEAQPGTLLDIVNRLDDADPQVLLFGHNPGLTELAQLLALVPFADMSTCGVAYLSFEVASWREVVPDSGTLLRYRFP